MTEEREELRRTVRAVLGRAPAPRPAPDAPAPYDEAARRLLAGQVGAFGLAVPEEHGGAGATLAEALVVCEELGRALTPLPYLGSAVLATQSLLACGVTEWLPALADGALVGALAWAEGGSWDPAAVRCRAEGGRLTGVKEHVLDGEAAGLLVVPARADGGDLGVYAVDPAAPGVRVEPLATLDRTRPQARVRLAGAPARLLSADGERVLGRLLAVAAAALAAEQVGGARRCLEMTLTHVTTRRQFGRPIGSFQAVKHRLADLYVLVESAASLGDDAARALAEEAPGLEVRAAAAQAYCSEAYRAAAAETLQLHGGIGFTWEHEAHLHLKRAHAAAELFGDAAWQRARLAPTVLGLAK
ncbi:acyl-CoA dehydrogenase family protein [Microbispora sp. ATCC PTA-5024]|uniref:acyl-CoA dehydrogenase family protein n=1 Tax=Microbispora sp. ATCC PTA-5024 TaxID=316330 RepID=UPI0003DC7004|nr:acyl-CoA dehydrogenase family protein [Microbispora sp. ATCC PTA-5024]ETK36997.1 hypothetical protein MPTA5024_06145 [Microbispora sp. ATCC PTA-5024]